MSSNHIEKPIGSQWTDDQWKAIVSSGKDILVAAAAGSGKTAVLVERIIKKILSTDNPIDVDCLLVMTFTNASAAEMRNRIGEALEKALKEQPASLHLRRQLTLLNRASISTIHSFCLNVIRKYYYMLDIDPGFRIANETEGELLRDEVLEELFEEYYSSESNELFFDLVDRYTNDRSDSDLQDMIRKLYDFSRAHPNPEKWLDEMIANYDVREDTEMEDTSLYPYLMADVLLNLNGAKNRLLQAMELTKQPGGPAPRAITIETDLEQLNRLLSASKMSWSHLYEEMQNLTYPSAKPCKGDEYDPDLLKRVTKLRDDAKDQVKKIKEELFSRQPANYLKDLREMKDVISMLVTLVNEFGNRFRKLKEEKGLVDFSDLEHYCLEILANQNDGLDLIPSDAALDYREQFEEVLVDEYQDTNMVQESILQLVTKEGEVSGNLFMVGDVKQSIYRFRLAEPFLFLGKYKRFTKDGANTGLRIDLSKNFRSRAEVLDGTNFLFRQIMGETVGEIEYDHDAELKLGAAYPDNNDMAAELLIIEREGKEEAQSSTEEDSEDEVSVLFDQAELETAQLEARLMAKKIKELIQNQFQVYDSKLKRTRNITYRDIVILLRSMPWAPQILEEFKQQGIPLYADLRSGYFNATEVAIMMSLLKVIDNPFQDIPLVSVLRSPIVGLDETELAVIRISSKQTSYYEAMTAFIKEGHTDSQLINKVKAFYENLQRWRTEARHGGLSDLIWQLYRETKFYDYVGGLPGGKQRQANLRALYDRARQYEATSFRGLFRFLRFIERMQDRGDDLGTARALGEQEDVVRLMTIHKSKGLEFPVVFVGGLSKQFNMMDLNKKYLLDKELGFGSKFVNPKLRISYPTITLSTMKKKMKLELIAEEMRVLYVALTRAKEKLYLVGTVKEFQKQTEKWQDELENKNWLLSDHRRALAKSYMDWIGPALIRHKDCELLRGEGATIQRVPEEIKNDSAKWLVELIHSGSLQEVFIDDKENDAELLEALKSGSPVAVESPFKDKIISQLEWVYPNQLAASHRSKQTVTEIKRQHDSIDESSSTEFIRKMKPKLADRPRFMQEKSLTPAEKGTAMHMVMQHIDFAKDMNEASLREQIAKMVNTELLTSEQAEGIDIANIVGFFHTEIGKRLTKAPYCKREIPFSLALPANEAYAKWEQAEEENILVQGVIDCIFEDENRLTLIDYKTDAITGRYKGGFEEAKPILEERYRTQIELYTKAIEYIWKKPLTHRYLYYFDGGHLLKL
ncbi:helicase-exonuclease AddAB subunit AddA [Bacillus luteolus]|uniref:ATP-dependent helicase/nuclease subunit A n=1 Tax=Litchfieldia luteola TaxID=682179 RepID=A0ABR9QLB4_9BACI|nr:helicase-exonuclease AddAB subunit AddA [Cytobacillus luteolus]MBE4909282.1 helicase-exonuclease AddAB subunit AddA [Cytobacillus luteolus]MBP1940676.1 ATP-dependent helicase/nuclease subunit A [Cytobacillus luteolus]